MAIDLDALEAVLAKATPGETIEQSFARKAYAIADAMLAARSAKNDA